MFRFFLLYVFLFLSITARAQNKFFWDESRDLVWSDFQSDTRPNNSNAAATTFCGISYRLSSSTKNFSSKQVEIRSFFVPSKSWVHPEHKTDVILLHEQGHFDIAELFARRFRKLIHDKTMDTSALQKYYEKIYKEYNNYQQDYETVTQNGRIRDKQYDYSDKINAEMEALSDFKT